MRTLAKCDYDVNLTAHEQVSLYEVAFQMKKSGLPETFIASAIKTAFELEGAADLVKMWASEIDITEQKEIIADLQDLIEDRARQGKREFKIKFNDLDMVSQNIRKFKDSLLKMVKDRGGIKKLSERTGIPQPSLSRFFNSNSIPHRSTLLKISEALGHDTVIVEFQRNEIDEIAAF